jgi:hypothetical protein
MFVRIKYEKTTFFIHANPEDPIVNLKREVCVTLTDETPQTIRLLLGNQALEDDETLKGLNIANNAVLFMCLQKKDGSGQWEEVNIYEPVYAANEAST